MQPDRLDLANDLADLHVRQTVKSIQAKGRELQPIGFCRWCHEPFESQSKKLFCDMDCNTDYEKSIRNT